MITAAATLRELFADEPLARVVAPSRSDEDDFGAFVRTTDESVSIDAPTVAGEPFRIYDVPIAATSGFTHFLDGAQRHWRCLYFGLLPSRLAHTSAAVVQRRERHMVGIDERAYAGGLEAFVPDVGKCVATARRAFEVQPVAVSELDTEATVAERIRKSISDRREAREIEVARQFDDGWLLVDGGIGHIAGPGDRRSVVGVVKTHTRQYFQSNERIQSVLNMREGQRTTAFHREADAYQGAAAYSFYLKLRESSIESPLFGIVRVELPQSEEMIERVDEVAGWLLHERAPLSLPDRRYDRLLYPIRLVEEHLRARQPSEASIRAKIGV